MIGNYYPFFLSNLKLNESYCLYEIFSPSLSPNLIPYFSLEKISEKTKYGPNEENSINIISQCLGETPISASREKEFVFDILKKEGPTIVKENDNGFPLIEMMNSNIIQKTLIINLRDSLRWRTYRFIPDRYVDILWTPTKFVVFKIKEDEKVNDTIYLEPVGMYENTDVNLENPLKVDLTKIEAPKVKFTGKGKASDLNRLIKRLEWNSFDRKEIKINK